MNEIHEFLKVCPYCHSNNEIEHEEDDCIKCCNENCRHALMIIINNNNVCYFNANDHGLIYTLRYWDLDNNFHIFTNGPCIFNQKCKITIQDLSNIYGKPYKEVIEYIKIMGLFK
jgi:hypothetical protein